MRIRITHVQHSKRGGREFASAALCLTLQEVLLHCDSDEDYDDDYFDDPDDPVIDGSDDEFSDLEGNDLDELEGDFDSGPNPSPKAGSPESSSASASPNSPDSSGSDSSGSPGSTTWTPTTTHIPIQPFTSPTGPIEDISDHPMEVFDLFFTPDLMEEIVKQSNEYAKVVMGPDKYDRWTKITVEEFKAFLGFSILMGINHLPSLDDYWSKDPRLRYAPVADRISRDRFREVSRYLHFVDNETLVPRGEEGPDRLGKVRPLIDHLSTKFAGVYQPHRDVAVNEAMIKFQGRPSLKQYMPLKPTKCGIKVWVAADSNGYFSRFEIYTGKKRNSTEHGLGARVVKTLRSKRQTPSCLL